MKKNKFCVLVLAAVAALCLSLNACDTKETVPEQPELGVIAVPSSVDVGTAVKLPKPTVAGHTVKITVKTPDGRTVRPNAKDVAVFGVSGAYEVTYTLLDNADAERDKQTYTVTAAHGDGDVLLRDFESEAELETIDELFTPDGGLYTYTINTDPQYVSHGNKSLKVTAKKAYTVDRSDPWLLLSLFGGPKAGTSVDGQFVPNICYVDMTEYAAIEYDVYWKAGVRQDVMTSVITDLETENTSNVYMPTAGQWQHVSIPFSQFSASFRSGIHTIGLGVYECAADLEYYVDNVRLVRTVDGGEKVLDFTVASDVDKLDAQSGVTLGFTSYAGSAMDGAATVTTAAAGEVRMHSMHSAIKNFRNDVNKRAINVNNLEPFSALTVEVKNTGSEAAGVKLGIKVGQQTFVTESFTIIEPGATVTVELDLLDAYDAEVDLFSFGVDGGENPDPATQPDGYISLFTEGAASLAVDTVILWY